MSAAGSFFSFAVIAVFAQNVLFSGAAGVSEMLEKGSTMRGKLLTGGLVSLFSLLGALVTIPFMLLFPFEMKYIPLYGLVLSLGVLLSYFLCARLVVRMGDIKERLGPYLAPSAINGAVLVFPLAANFSENISVASMLGLSIGSGIGYFVASLLVGMGMRAADSPHIPKVMRGIPAALIYIGIICLGMCAVGGSIRFI